MQLDQRQVTKAVFSLSGGNPYNLPPQATVLIILITACNLFEGFKKYQSGIVPYLLS